MTSCHCSLSLLAARTTRAVHLGFHAHPPRCLRFLHLGRSLNCCLTCSADRTPKHSDATLQIPFVLCSCCTTLNGSFPVALRRIWRLPFLMARNKTVRADPASGPRRACFRAVNGRSNCACRHQRPSCSGHNEREAVLPAGRKERERRSLTCLTSSLT